MELMMSPSGQFMEHHGHSTEVDKSIYAVPPASAASGFIFKFVFDKLYLYLTNCICI